MTRLEAEKKGGAAGTAVPLTRIYIGPEGDLVVTDLWEPIAELLAVEQAEEGDA